MKRLKQSHIGKSVSCTINDTTVEKGILDFIDGNWYLFQNNICGYSPYNTSEKTKENTGYLYAWYVGINGRDLFNNFYIKDVVFLSKTRELSKSNIKEII